MKTLESLATLLKQAIDQSVESDTRTDDSIPPACRKITYNADILVVQLWLIISMLEDYR